jgi:uncharacterized protein Usg
MRSLVKEFLAGTQRVTVNVYYFRPLEAGQEPLKLQSKIIGEEPTKLHHTGILQQFVYQEDDRADLDEGLKEIFAEIMQTSGGILKIHDRRERVTLMQKEAQLAAQRKLADGSTIESTAGVQVPQILIPTKQEQSNPGMAEINKAFTTLVPYPRLRSFLQDWQDNKDGPLHHVQYAISSLSDSNYSNHYAIN